MKKILVYQPIIAKYQIGFLEELFKKDRKIFNTTLGFLKLIWVSQD